MSDFLDAVEKREIEVDRRLGQLEDAIDTKGTEIDNVDTILDNVLESLEKINARIDKIEDRLDNIQVYTPSTFRLPFLSRRKGT